MITDLCREKINSYDDENARWRLANNILYNTAASYPNNTNENEIVAKMWIIGRTYAAAIERRPNKDDTSGDFYYDYVAPKLIESSIDEKISNSISFLSILEKQFIEISPLFLNNYISGSVSFLVHSGNIFF